MKCKCGHDEKMHYESGCVDRPEDETSVRLNLKYCSCEQFDLDPEEPIRAQLTAARELAQLVIEVSNNAELIQTANIYLEQFGKE